MLPWQQELFSIVEARTQHESWRDSLLIRVSSADQVMSRSFSHESLGELDRCDRRPFRIASVTKVYVAAALFRLMEMRVVSHGEAIGERISPRTHRQLKRGGFDPQAITIDHLLRHTSGMTDHSISESFIKRLVEEPTRRWSREEQIDLAMTLKGPLCNPGQRFIYSDTGYLLLGEIIEQVSGLALPAALHNLLKFEQIELKLTQFDSSEALAETGPLMEQWLGDVHTTDFHPSFDLFGGGGLVSTLEEIDRFFRALFDGRILSAETLAGIFATQTTDCGFDGLTHNGLMFRKRDRRIDCWGHTGYWGVLAAYFPATRQMIAATFNRARAPDTYGADELLDDTLASMNKVAR